MIAGAQSVVDTSSRSFGLAFQAQTSAPVFDELNQGRKGRETDPPTPNRRLAIVGDDPDL